MKDPNQLILQALKGDLSLEDRNELEDLMARDAAFKQRFEQEKSLDHALGRLPDAPLPTNFTARVMQQVELELRRGQRAPVGSFRRWFQFRLARVAAGLAAVALVAGTSVFQYQRIQTARLARSVSALREVASVVGTENAPEVFQDFEVIRGLSLPAETELDLELLVALQK